MGTATAWIATRSPDDRRMDDRSLQRRLFAEARKESREVDWASYVSEYDEDGVTLRATVTVT